MLLLQYKWVFYDYLSQIYVDPTLRSLRRHSFHSLENSVPSISASTSAADTSQNSWCYLRSRRQKCFKVLTKPCLSDMLLLNFSLWNEITFCIHCSPVAGLSGCMYIRFGISGSAFPATIHRLKQVKQTLWLCWCKVVKIAHLDVFKKIMKQAAPCVGWLVKKIIIWTLFASSICCYYYYF